MKIKIICVGKIKEQFYKDAVDEYLKRLQKFADVKIIELPDEKTSESASLRENEIVLEKEGNRIIEKIDKKDHVIALCIEGKKMSSEALACRLSDIFMKTDTVSFIIGGSLGLSEKVKSMSDLKLSFSDMTFPHQLMRVVLLEQIYRTFKINNNEPYHK